MKSEENIMKEYIKKKIAEGRKLTKLTWDEGVEIRSDQQLKITCPPLVKDKMADVQIDLPYNFNDLKMNNNFLQIIQNRKSHRMYTGEKMSLLQLSFLLYATQGIKSIRQPNATFRTVPCGGARHEFETYFIVRDVEELKNGAYHYLPMSHQIELINEIENIEKTIETSVNGQAWANKCNVLIYWSAIPYRSEWRYSIWAHRPLLMDIGHVCQNLYLAAEAIGLGTCGLASFSADYCAPIFKLDNEDEYIIYCAPVGVIDSKNEDPFVPITLK